MMGNNEAAFQQILVSAKSLRSLYTKGDIVVLNFAPSLPKCMQTAFQDLCIRVKNVQIPVTRNDVTNPIYKKVIDDINKWWDFAKLLAYDIVDYSKVVFVDGDTMFLRDPDVWLAQPPGTCTDGPKSPFNSGMFVLEPSSEDFLTLLGLVRNGDYDLKTGWGGAFRDEEKKYVFKFVYRRKRGAVERWLSTCPCIQDHHHHHHTHLPIYSISYQPPLLFLSLYIYRYRPRTYAPFYGAETTQGLFYYFYHDLKNQYNALYPREAFHYQGNEDPPGLDRSKDGEMPHLVHFNICPKPQPGKAMEECPEMHRKWNEMFDSLKIADCHM
jgi:hypothetical protein